MTSISAAEKEDKEIIWKAQNGRLSSEIQNIYEPIRIKLGNQIKWMNVSHQKFFDIN